MAVDVCSASDPFISPRISFSLDLNNHSSDTATTTTTTAAATTTTFDFCITPNLMQQITSADELFFDGILLPTQIKKPENHGPEPKATVSENEGTDVHRKRLKDLLSDTDQEQEKPSVTSFWRFARSTSLNSNNGISSRPKRLFRSLSLKRLLRSNSTDSALNPKGNEATKVIKESNSRKEPAMLERCIQSPSTHYGGNGNHSCRRSATKQNSGGGYDGRIKINPILNIPPVYDMKFFGSGSLFCNGKSKNKTK